MLKKFTITVNLISCLTTISWAQAADQCFDMSLDAEKGPSLLRPAFTAEECGTVNATLKTSGRFPNIFTAQGDHLYPGLCFISDSSDPFAVTDGVHAKLGSKAVTISSVSAWTNEFTPNLPAPPFYLTGSDNVIGVITQWTVRDASTNKSIGRIFTTDTMETSRILTAGEANELDVIIGGTDRLSGAKGSVRIDSAPNPQGLPQITGLTGKLCIPAR